MGFLTVFLIALGLAADCFVVALGGSISGKKGISLLQAGRVSLSFGVFQGLMPVIGWFAGLAFVKLISNFDHWIALVLLGFIGSKMIWESLHSKEEEKEKDDISRGWVLLTLSVATSIDALAVGLTFAFIKVDIPGAALTIGLVAAAVTALGFYLGKKAHHLIGSKAEIIGGLLLIGIGVKIFIDHML